MKIKVIRICTNCLYYYFNSAFEEIHCFEKDGCEYFAPIGLKLKEVELIVE